MNTTTVRAIATNAEALRTMKDLNQDAIVVVDDQCRFKGVVEHDRIINHIMVELVNGGEES
jgi:hypothetical protein